MPIEIMPKEIGGEGKSHLEHSGNSFKSALKYDRCTLQKSVLKYFKSHLIVCFLIGLILASYSYIVLKISIVWVGLN